MDTGAIVVLFVGLAIAALLVWLLWRICIWCLVLVAAVSLWLLETLPPIIYIPLMVILAVIA